MGNDEVDTGGELYTLLLTSPSRNCTQGNEGGRTNSIENSGWDASCFDRILNIHLTYRQVGARRVVSRLLVSLATKVESISQGIDNTSSACFKVHGKTRKLCIMFTSGLDVSI